MTTAVLGQTATFSVKAGDIIFVDAGGVGKVTLYSPGKQPAQTDINGSIKDISVQYDGTASVYLESGSFTYSVNNPGPGASLMTRDQRKSGTGLATSEQLINIGITTPTASLRGAAKRGGWPNANTPSMNFSPSMFRVSPGQGHRLVFVGATTFEETSARAGTLNARVEIPYGSGNWATATFNAVEAGTFIQTGSLPAAENNYFLLVSDPLPTNFTEETLLRVVCSGKGGVPTMTNFDGMFEGRPNLEFNLQSSSTLDATLMLSAMPQAKLDLILDTVESDGLGMPILNVSNATWAGGNLTLTINNHNVTNNAGNRLLLNGFVSSLAAIDDVYTYTTSGASQIIVPLASDPGVISAFGIARIAQTIESASYSAGVITFTRSAHARIEGQIINIRGATSVSGNINGDYILTSVAANTFTVDYPSDPGAITTTKAISSPKYISPAVDYHLRPLTIICNHNVASLFLASNSTTQSIDRIQDETRLCGVAQRCVGELFYFIDGSANGEGIFHWNANPNQVIIREKIMEMWCQGIVFDESKNDEDAYATTPLWIAGHNDWWNRPVQSSLKTSKFNMAVLASSRNVFSRDNFSTVDGQLKPTNTRLIGFHEFLRSLKGSLYSHIFDYVSILTERNQAYNFKVSDECYPITFSTTSGSAVVTVDAATPLNRSMHRKVVALNFSGTWAYRMIYYISPTKFISSNPMTGNRLALAFGTTISNSNGIVNARKFIAYDGTLASSLHENPAATAELRDTIALKELT